MLKRGKKHNSTHRMICMPLLKGSPWTRNLDSLSTREVLGATAARGISIIVGELHVKILEYATVWLMRCIIRKKSLKMSMRMKLMMQRLSHTSITIRSMND